MSYSKNLATASSLWVPVVAGILYNEQKVLLGLRPPDKPMPHVWEFPGGKVNHGESPEQALQRELLEEIDVKADVGPLRYATTHLFGKNHILLLFYDVFNWQGSPTPLHHKALRWVAPSEMNHLSIPEANQNALNFIFPGILFSPSPTPSKPLVRD